MWRESVREQRRSFVTVCDEILYNVLVANERHQLKVLSVSRINDFIGKVATIHKTGAATEHSYRPALESLFNSLSDGVAALNEPKRVECGAPDFIIQRGDIAIGHVEAKDLGVDLRNMKDANRRQQDRYLAALPNLIYTNCFDWDFYRNGERVASLTIADYQKDIRPQPERYGELENLLRDFIAQRPQTIDTPRALAERMAGKAALIKDVLFKALSVDEEMQTDLTKQYQAFREHLIHDITLEEFSDIYAETIAYGMFAARLHDTTLGTFSRQEALELLPRSNPFLRSLFGYVAGHDLDDRITWIIDDLAAVFQATNAAKLMAGFGKLTGKEDPFLHFYETFLAAYNPKKRKARGVWYTPEPVVNFVVRAVDEVLITHFGLPDGLADTSKVTIDWDTGQADKKGRRQTIKKSVHRIQILDPATGTGTFLAEVVKQVAPKVKSVAGGMWSTYVEKELIPRLHGFELLMASYAMCHMKLDLILTELGYKPTKAPPRLSVYLTNSLEEGEPANQTLPFAQWLSNEAKAANTVKRDMPIMCVIGNPPYNSSSANNGAWIRGELSAYKKGLNEQKINLDDDYIKFLRFSEGLIEKNRGGVLAMITNNSFLDGVTQRVMRRHLRETFDSIYILNLHGDIRTEGTDSETDENVFDITQGVSISIMFASSGMDRTKLCPVYYASLSGKRKDKYAFLESTSILNGEFKQIPSDAPNYRFLPSDNQRQPRYDEGLKIVDLFSIYSSGIQTKQDALCVAESTGELQSRLDDFQNLSENDIRHKYDVKDSRDWTVLSAKKDVIAGGDIVPFLYKPFDRRRIFYSGRTRGFVAYPRREVMRHMVGGQNVALIINRQTVKDYFSFAGVTDIACCHGTFYLGNRGQDYCLPLYLYPDHDELDQSRRVNFDPKNFRRMQSLAKDKEHGIPSEMDVFDYIYGVLHCPGYRQAYSELLKTDFPRIPWPESPGEFWDVSMKGGTLRRLHLMDPGLVGDAIFPFIGPGDGVVGSRPQFSDGKIWINASQYFDQVSEVSWEFSFGGYQPAQKWLKDRKGEQLTFENIKHYQRVLKIMVETDRIMNTITMTLDVA